MIKVAQKADALTVAKLAIKLWNDNTVEKLESLFSNLIDKDDALMLLLYENSVPSGFAQCQLRYDYVEGTESSPVGYLEGIFIDESCRKKGYAKALLEECEKWAHDKGCTEFASDCVLDNDFSLAFHKAVGFLEANRIICFTKKLI